MPAAPDMLKAFFGVSLLDKVVKMVIAKRFGVDENQQVVSFKGDGNNTLLSETATLSLLSFKGVPELKVELIQLSTIAESDLQPICPLGSGSYGTVVKCLHIPSAREIVSGLRHPNIVKCTGTCVTGPGRLQIVSEHLSFNEVAAISLNIAKGMDSLHRQKYMHRDLSSNNVLFGSEGVPKICDFGVSQVVGHERSSKEYTAAPATTSPTTMGVEQVTDDQVNDCVSQWLSLLTPYILASSSH
ncbi:hypothetical protein Pelo_14718 [Pelomyxa schiedti]|nr:hypothetical protein Pelo_14718 [Pelomyxa schiedti]